MCMLCVEIIKGRMTFAEARRAIGEISMDERSEHEGDLLEAVVEEDLEKLELALEDLERELDELKENKNK